MERKKLLPNGKLTVEELLRIREVVAQACHRMCIEAVTYGERL